jgi:hypothetical protein
MFHTIIKQWHIWVDNGVNVSNEETKELIKLNSMDGAIIWLYLEGHHETGRELHKRWSCHVKNIKS